MSGARVCLRVSFRLALCQWWLRSLRRCSAAARCLCLARLHLWRALAACLCRLAPTCRVLAASASLDVSSDVRVAASDIDVVAGRRLSAYAGESLALASDAVAVNAGSTMSMFASESASVSSGVVSVSSSESLSVEAGDFDFVSSGARHPLDRRGVGGCALGLSMTALESIRVGASSMSVGAGSDVDVSAGGELSGLIGESVEIVIDGAEFSSAGRTEVTSLGGVNVAAGDSLTLAMRRVTSAWTRHLGHWT